jgi:hypothetical protein
VLLVCIDASTAQNKMAWMSKAVVVQEFADQSQEASTSPGTAEAKLPAVGVRDMRESDLSALKTTG